MLILNKVPQVNKISSFFAPLGLARTLSPWKLWLLHVSTDDNLLLMRSREILEHALYAGLRIVLKPEAKTRKELGVDPNGFVLFTSWFNILENSPVF